MELLPTIGVALVPPLMRLLWAVLPAGGGGLHSLRAAVG